MNQEILLKTMDTFLGNPHTPRSIGERLRQIEDRLEAVADQLRTVVQELWALQSGDRGRRW